MGFLKLIMIFSTISISIIKLIRNYWIIELVILDFSLIFIIKIIKNYCIMKLFRLVFILASIFLTASFFSARRLFLVCRYICFIALILISAVQPKKRILVLALQFASFLIIAEYSFYTVIF